MVITKPMKNEVPVMDERTKQKFEELKNRYFWQQKRKEIGFALCIILIICLAMFVIIPLIGLALVNVFPNIVDLMNKNFSQTSEPYTPYVFTNSYADYLLVGFLALAGLFGIAAGLFFFGIMLYGTVGVVIIDWINDNKKLAENRARKALGIIEPTKKINEIDNQIRYY